MKYEDSAKQAFWAIAGILAILWLLTGCKTVRYVPIEKIRVEYVNNLQRDSIVMYDSIYIREKIGGRVDTFLMEKYKYIYRDKYIKDSVFLRDSIPYAVEVVIDREVNKLTQWQTLQIWFGRALLLIILVWLIKKKFF